MAVYEKLRDLKLRLLTICEKLDTIEESIEDIEKYVQRITDIINFIKKYNGGQVPRNIISINREIDDMLKYIINDYRDLPTREINRDATLENVIGHLRNF
uniref:t-SNARE coiled-coil homology domain-containing protein n=1 Tax=Parastrongyloides trichosuri TaxID=131310 RepID=A0A0N4ZA97_PARTI